MKSRVSVRGQTVIPQAIRKELGIHPEQTLEWQVRDGVAYVFPLPDDPIQASRGILQRLGAGFSTEDLLEDRRRGREHEEKLDSRW